MLSISLMGGAFMRIRMLALAVVVSGLLAQAVQAEDWPQWRGPKRDGVSKERNLLQAWPEGGPKLLWQVKDAGYGYGSLTVAGGRIYLVGNKVRNEDEAKFLEAETPGLPVLGFLPADLAVQEATGLKQQALDGLPVRFSQGLGDQHEPHRLPLQPLEDGWNLPGAHRHPAADPRRGKGQSGVRVRNDEDLHSFARIMMATMRP